MTQDANAIRIRPAGPADAEAILDIYALISMPNPASVALHRAFGFEDIGLHRRTGYKFSRWLDVLWMEKRLGDFNRPPGKILGVDALRAF